MDVYVQVNASREDSKSGIAPEEAEGLITELRGLSRMKLRGLHGDWPARTHTEEMPPSSRPAGTEGEAHRIRCHARGGHGAVHGDERNDFELAIAEGTTMVRVGSRRIRRSRLLLSHRPTSTAHRHAPESWRGASPHDEGSGAGHVMTPGLPSRR